LPSPQWPPGQDTPRLPTTEILLEGLDTVSSGRKPLVKHWTMPRDRPTTSAKPLLVVPYSVWWVMRWTPPLP